jgi:hypothetical protein
MSEKEELWRVLDVLTAELSAQAHISEDEARLLLKTALENTKEIVIAEALGDSAEG